MSTLAKLRRCLRYDWPLHFVLRLTDWLPDNVIFLRLRGFLAGPFIGRCGKHLELGRHVSIYNPEKLLLGENVYMAYGTVILAGAPIDLGSEVIVGPYTVMSSSNHSKKNGSFRFGSPQTSPITVGAGTWIGAHVSILAGANIGKGCLVAAQACVLEGSFPDHWMLAGVPAKGIKKNL